MPLLSSQAVILQTMDFGESDKLITLYSRKFGKFTAIAKGAKRSRKRFVNKLEIFTQADFLCQFKKNQMARIEQAESVASFPALRAEFPRYTAACLIVELALHWMRDHDPDQNVFDLLVWALKEINHGDQTATVLIAFAVKIVSAAGYRPNLEYCCRCKKKHTAGYYVLNAALGGIVCSYCLGWEGSSDSARKGMPPPLSPGTVNSLNLILQLPPNKLDRLRFSGQAEGEAIAVLRTYIDSLLGREVLSWRFLTDCRNKKGGR